MQFGTTEIKALVADITKVYFVDTIVNPAGETLLGESGVDQEVHKAAGPELLEECKKLGGCKPGEAKLTGAYDLPCRHIIHTVAPTWEGGENNEPAVLAACYRHSLKVAAKNNIHSIAFYTLSTGTKGYPYENAAQVAVEAVCDYVKSHPDDFDEIVWVSRSSHKVQVFNDAIKRRVESED